MFAKPVAQINAWFDIIQLQSTTRYKPSDKKFIIKKGVVINDSPMTDIT